jgi:hypothetical protein
MTRRLAKETSNISPRKLTTVKDGFEHRTCFRRQQIKTRFLLSPKQNARPQAVRLHQRFHKRYLIDADFKEEARKCSKGLFAQVAAAIQIIAPGKITLA